MTNWKTKIAAVALGSILALVFAFYWQYARGLHPCELCLWQRWIYASVILLALFSLVDPRLKSLLVLALAAETGVAIYHSGIELHWWQGFQNCSTSLEAGSTLEEIHARLMHTPLVRCDEPVWHFVGLSMAGWNAIYAFILFLFAISAIFTRKAGKVVSVN